MATAHSVFPAVAEIIQRLDGDSIPDTRREVLSQLADYLSSATARAGGARLNFICTHNSRRSHLCQVWAQTLACYYGVRGVTCYSGGTQATAVYPEAVATLVGDGFEVETIASAANPVYAVKFSGVEHPVIAFSKTYDDPFNPAADFAAVMTCAQADGDCPYVTGAERRISLPFDDPKAYDDDPQRAEHYQATSRQIATELSFVFSRISPR